MIPMRTIPMFLSAAICGTAFGQTLRGAWVVCTRDLELHETLLDHADERELVLRSAYGIRSRILIDDVLFMVRAQPQDDPDNEIVGAPLPAQRPERLVWLTDGQVVRGTLLEPKLPEQLVMSLIAARSVRGHANLPIERVLRISDVQRVLPSPGSVLVRDDTLITRTGDEIVGFFESIGPMTRISLSDGTEIEIETSRIREMYLANEPEIQAGIYLTLSDREILRVAGFAYDNQQPLTVDIDTVALGLEDSGSGTWIFDTGSLHSLRLIDPARRVVALGDIMPDRVEPTGDRAWVPSPVLLDRESLHPTLASIDLRSPIRVHYPLPRGATRFACSIEAPIEQWTDCVVRVIARTGAVESNLLEQRFNRDTPSVDLNTALPAGTSMLVIEIDPGEYGPIQDRVLLHRPRLLIEE